MPLDVIRGPDNAPMDPLRDRTVTILGYGNQGAAHAANLRESGLHVVVGARPGSPTGADAAAAGFPVEAIADAAAAGDLVVVALPDEAHGTAWTEIGPALRPGATVGFLHGYSLRYGLVAPAPEIGVVMVAPKGPGATLRARYVRGEGIPCLFAVEAETETPAGHAAALGLAWASGIGCGRAAIVRTTFADETETDLFGEQSVLCGAHDRAHPRGLRDRSWTRGTLPELAYLECCHEVKQVADLVYERGLRGMTMAAISNTAEFGTYNVRPGARGRVTCASPDADELLDDDPRSGAFAEASAATITQPAASRGSSRAARNSARTPSRPPARRFATGCRRRRRRSDRAVR